MPVDRPRPLATTQQMDQSTLRDLIAGLDPDEKRDLMLRATRACENYCQRRLAPFVGLTETHRADGIDPADLVGIMPEGDVSVVSAASFGRAIGSAPAQARQVWLDQYAPMFPEMWTYSDLTIRILRSDGSDQEVPVTDLLGGEVAADSGHLWFRVGTYLPPGSRVKVTYSGGYTTVPQDLVNACRYMAAADVIDEDEFPDGPGANTHGNAQGRADAGFLARAQKLLKPYRRHT